MGSPNSAERKKECYLLASHGGDARFFAAEGMRNNVFHLRREQNELQPGEIQVGE